MEEGSAVDISLDNGHLVIRPVRSTKYQLTELLSKVTDDNVHEEISTGDAVGREIW